MSINLDYLTSDSRAGAPKLSSRVYIIILYYCVKVKLFKLDLGG